ncbi:hypothetical protein H9P43_000410 [Blastocladiella emersonii ATCC 22665]|nr:hypothetical protein H9P43_000410 [Blastocladiella emersonii ATCC 22665]
MDTSLDDVQKHCGPELKSFQDCLFQTTHPSNCNRARVELNLCTDKKVPSVRMIREKCAEEYKTFAACLDRNPNEPESCIGDVRAFYECAEGVREFLRKDGA